MITEKLYRVDFDPKIEDKNWVSMRDWCNENCHERFYWGPSWAGSFIEFEDSSDAMRFSLRWL